MLHAKLVPLLLSASVSAALAEPQSPPSPKAQPVTEPLTKTKTQTLAPASTTRRVTGPGMSEGPLSQRFPEIEVKISASFAHDRGMMSTIESLKVGGVEIRQDEIFTKLVALRRGWTQAGDASPEAALTVFKQFNEDWYAVIPHATRVSQPTLPSRPNPTPGEPLPAYHPPKFELRTLEDGDHVVLHSYFTQWDGGNHGTQTGYNVEAYRVSTGAPYPINHPLPAPSR